MKTQAIILLTLLMVGISNITAEEKENSKEAITTLTTSISGTITDATTGESLVGVKVVLEELNTVVYTDFDGNYEFTNISVGKYTVSTDYVSYKTCESLSIDTNKSNALNIILKADL
ncbi:carboxypeptidase-like regulatory domain-containing protein [Carboxylicivirga sediminis]|uniref:Carboxypeptidase-like regulatory domain-containing protein n=1 Tax=Carboxylicivirga sediminis TaxID=2006564 RepID=A0A941F566_9BACT|nr:carboxypeptidase-like regulatory domain-containing protein [Carboxylicivirga sediminis]MBR8537063.1 carboxypeptidase-like regulatory domain-containing protein [Carboxylicivirga sediminis]